MKWRIAAITVIVSALSGCMKSDNPVAPTPQAYISIMHLAPTAPSLDVFFNENRVSNTPFSPGTVTSAYNAVNKGAFSVKFKKTSSDSIVTELPLVQYDSLSFYTLFIYNEQTNGPVKVIRIKDDFAGLESSKPYYRFFHGSPNTAAIDLYLDNVKIENSRTNADNAGNGLLNKFFGTTSGQHIIQARLAGTDTVLATANVEFMPGNAYTIFLRGLEGGTGTSQLALSILRAS